MNIGIILKSACANGGHVNIGVTVDGGAEQIYHVQTDDLRQSIQPEEKEEILLSLLRLSVAGLTRNQARTKLINGYTVTL